MSATLHWRHHAILIPFGGAGPGLLQPYVGQTINQGDNTGLQNENGPNFIFIIDVLQISFRCSLDLLQYLHAGIEPGFWFSNIWGP